MDAFKLQRRILDDYNSYVKSFLQIRDPQIREFVNQELAKGALWPEPLLQLNPAYEAGPGLAALVEEGLLHPLCTEFFVDDQGQPVTLRYHQAQAVRLAAQKLPYVLTTGTGSGKSLTYFLPIVDHVLKNKPERASVRAIIVYPMNALINSQLDSMRELADSYQQRTGQAFPVRFARYTGQEKDIEKQATQDNPPHILLTNYVMLELMLTRPRERVFVEQAIAELNFLVLDELHTYSGRQGADVAMLIRRLRERCGNPHLRCIGTSATMSAGGTRADQCRDVAQVASRLFGLTVSPEQVIDETLRPATAGLAAAGETLAPQLRAAVLTGVPADLTYEALMAHPAAIWIEQTFGLRRESGHLRRRQPITLAAGAEQLAEVTNLPLADCRAYLEGMFALGSRLRGKNKESLFAFKLHQFISQGGAVYATLETPGHRHLTLAGQTFAPGSQGERPLFPVLFCRECGQEYLHGRLKMTDLGLTGQLLGLAGLDDNAGEEGYLLVEDPNQPVWDDSRIADLPDNCFRETKTKGRVVQKDYEKVIPRRLWLRPDGSAFKTPDLAAEHGDDTATAWFIPSPFLTCLHCGVVYTRRDREFRKLARLSSEGRSTATTLLGLSIVAELRRQPNLSPKARKLLSFTDNRQDASLQAGHFNDFIQVALLRAAIYRALPADGAPLGHSEIAPATVAALNLPQEVYAREVGMYGTAKKRNERALHDLLEYRIYEDLRRGWRVVQPNLEQCGLLRIAYDGLAEMCADPTPWQNHPVLATATPEVRQRAAQAFLDFLRRALALDARCLQEDEQREWISRVYQQLKDPWSLDQNERLQIAHRFVVGTSVTGEEESSLSGRSALGRYLRSQRAWPHLPQNLNTEEYEAFLPAWLEVLQGGGFLTVEPWGDGHSVQLQAGALLWQRGNGQAMEPDPVRSRWLRSGEFLELEREANAFFHHFYRQEAALIGPMEGREHTR